jgi:hypothetical protein
LIYSTLFGIGKLIFKEWAEGILYIAAAVITSLLISRNLSAARWTEPGEAEA